MTRALWFTAVLALVTVGVQAWAFQTTMTDEEYEAAMKEIRLTVLDSQGHIDARYWPELERQVGRLETFFGQVETFWSARGSDAAVGFAQDALQALAGLSTAAGERDHGAAQDALKTLQVACQSCHGQFREEIDDDYRIKPED